MQCRITKFDVSCPACLNNTYLKVVLREILKADLVSLNLIIYISSAKYLKFLQLLYSKAMRSIKISFNNCQM